MTQKYIMFLHNIIFVHVTLHNAINVLPVPGTFTSVTMHGTFYTMYLPIAHSNKVTTKPL